MGLFDRVERTLDRVINGAFARAFKAEVQPVEIAAAMRRAMDDRAAVVGKGRTIVPNAFTIELDPHDHDRLTQYEDVLVDELVASVEEYAESQHYQPGGPLQVDFVVKDDLDTGVFRVRPSTTSTPARRRRGPAAPSPAASRAERRARRDAQEEAAAADELPRRHSPHPPEATSQPEGEIAVAGRAASAAAGATAGVAAARERALRQDMDGWPVDDDVDGADPDDAPTSTMTPAAAEPPPPLVDPSHRPWLEIDGDTYPLLGAITVLGRDETADITLSDAGISRRHCEIRVTHDGPHLVIGLRDLGSTNGTFVNGERVDTTRLSDGDRVTIGRVTFDLRTKGR
ncbi:FhaA domain-containing protein [Agilicoccus flavus]|uniref:FhaA domain-containing protein n=1 Tax=Agilicoccus flavus TaxID=2775968 RepID=UPI001CF714ED|nr:DUF3662 and FHA domain-containing protein [Agilicoccus flavus]